MIHHLKQSDVRWLVFEIEIAEKRIDQRLSKVIGCRLQSLITAEHYCGLLLITDVDHHQGLQGDPIYLLKLFLMAGRPKSVANH